MLSKIPVAFPSLGSSTSPQPKTTVNQPPGEAKQKETKHRVFEHPIKHQTQATQNQKPKPAYRFITQHFFTDFQTTLSTNSPTLRIEPQTAVNQKVRLNTTLNTTLKRRPLISNSFTGDYINPIIDARLQISMSAHALAKRLGLSRQYIQRAEAGTYSSLNPALLKWVANRLMIEPTAVTKRYKDFQWATRRATVEKIAPPKLTRTPGNKEDGSVLFERWRSGYWPSSVAFSNAFCVHTETVRTYEEGIRKEMPDAIHKVLIKLDLIDLNWIERPGAEALSGSLTP